MRTRDFALAILMAPWASAHAQDPFRHLLELEGGAASRPESSGEDLVIGEKSRRARWEERLRWVELEGRLDSARERAAAAVSCRPMEATLGRMLEVVAAERAYFEKNCERVRAQTRACAASLLRFDAMLDALAPLEPEIEACEPDAVTLALAPPRSNGRLGLGVRVAHEKTSSASDTDSFPTLDLRSQTSGAIGSTYRYDVALIAESAWFRGNLAGQHSVEASNEFAFDTVRFDLGFAVAHARGFFDLDQTTLNTRTTLEPRAGIGFEAGAVDASVSYRPSFVTSTNAVYDGIRHDVDLRVLPAVARTGIGYRLGHSNFRADNGAVFPSYSSTRFLLDLSRIGRTRFGERELLVGVEERRDASRVVRLAPYFSFEERFGPYPGAAWLLGGAGPTAFATRFDSTMRLELRTRENELGPTNQIVRAEGELRLLGDRLSIPLRLSGAWEKNVIAGVTGTPESFLVSLGIVPTWRVSGRFFIELELNYRRRAFFDKIEPDPSLWVDPFESFEAYGIGLKTHYEF